MDDPVQGWIEKGFRRLIGMVITLDDMDLLDMRLDPVSGKWRVAGSLRVLGMA